MSFSAQPPRRIASNFVWYGERLLRHPLVTLSGDGRLLSLACRPDPDREPLTEFYAGVLVPGFPADWRGAFERLRARPERLLDALLAELGCPVEGGVWVVLSGIDYATLRLTARARIRRL